MFDANLLQKIRDRLVARNETLAVAESVTAGLLQFAFAQAKDASCFFQGGLTAYNLGQKAVHLCVEPIHAEACNCVSEKVSAQMAAAVCKRFSADWGIAITGYAAHTESIQQPFAYYHIVRGEEPVDWNRIESQKPEGPDTQQYYVSVLLERFIAVL